MAQFTHLGQALIMQAAEQQECTHDVLSAEGAKVQQPRASPWVGHALIMHPVGLQEDERLKDELFGSETRGYSE